MNSAAYPTTYPGYSPTITKPSIVTTPEQGADLFKMQTCEPDWNKMWKNTANNMTGQAAIMGCHYGIHLALFKVFDVALDKTMGIFGPQWSNCSDGTDPVITAEYFAPLTTVDYISCPAAGCCKDRLGLKSGGATIDIGKGVITGFQNYYKASACTNKAEERWYCSFINSMNHMCGDLHPSPTTRVYPTRACYTVLFDLFVSKCPIMAAGKGGISEAAWKIFWPKEVFEVTSVESAHLFGLMSNIDRMCHPTDYYDGSANTPSSASLSRVAILLVLVQCLLFHTFSTFSG